MLNKIPVIVVCGPTASGKTSLAIELAKRYNGEIVSADSMQIYRGMDIGTAKPDEEEKQGIPHHMLDIVDITDNYSVSDYCTAAHEIISDINSRGKLPIVCGGTGLYIDSLINDINFSESNNCEKIRGELTAFHDKYGSEKLYDLLKSLDPVAAEAIHMNNVKRVIRAIEHIKLTGELFSDYKKKAIENESRYSAEYFMIDMDRELLYERINKRVDIMLEAGLLEEARRIYDMNLSRNLTALCGIGYKELFEYFDGNCTLQEAVDAIKQNSRHYAKRQLTWFRRNKKIHLLDYNKDLIMQTDEILKEL